MSRWSYARWYARGWWRHHIQLQHTLVQQERWFREPTGTLEYVVRVFGWRCWFCDYREPYDGQ